LALAYDLKSPSFARRFVEECAAPLWVDGMATVASMVASELVSNAVAHGAAPIELALQYDEDEVTVEVTDGDARTNDVHLRAFDHQGTGGYGLRIVALLADRWGTSPLPSGKTVWATITLDSARR
jgi:anti-sigma regulatory factor (Ser/Thr protein kinase)